MSERGVTDEPKAGNRLGCLLVFLPTVSFFIVMPDAAHVWEAPWSNPLLWLVVGIASWLALRWLIDLPVAALRKPTRFLVCGLLLTASVLLAVQILRSI